MFVVVSGNPADGFSYVGPFEDVEDSRVYTDRLDIDWWLCQLEPPEGPDAKTWVVTVASDFIPPIIHKDVEIVAVSAEEAKELYQGGGIVVRVQKKT